ncbi:MAG: RNA pseudouridine synthase, partial [Oscillospiraceae bacterium]|nr:RNA pseudouridine synthase [Oscillospiraceae bacterium]
MNRLEFTVDGETEGIRIDKWVCGQDCGISRSMLQKLLSEGKVSVNGKPAVKSYSVRCG